MNRGFTGKVLFVNLTSRRVKEELLQQSIYRDFLGGYGLGVRILYERMKPNSDSLGPDNIIGFAPGILTATGAPMSSRYEVVAKSPLTNAWAQANSGGYFGHELKKTGYDALFFTGISSRPVYLLIHEGKVELKDAGHLWGKDTVETEKILRDELDNNLIKVACIGPSGESLSLISCVINDKGRAAARSGVGAVMGSKRLKAVAVKGNTVAVPADPERVKTLRRNYLKSIHESQDLRLNIFKNYGTCGFFLQNLTVGDAPIKNWSLTGIEAFPTAEKIHKDNVTKYLVKRFTCANCPIGCGGIMRIGGGSYTLPEAHKPEYETLASFGSLCLNDDIESIIKANDICNRYGLDTLSAGTTIAFAIECYENNIISRQETDGIELTWGNAHAIVTMLGKLARREGFGGILADGVKRAAERIGRGTDRYAMHIGGQEPGCRDPRLNPTRGVGYIADPAPGRHTATTLQMAIGKHVSSYPELQIVRELEGEALDAVTNKYQAMVSSAGLCFFAIRPDPAYPVTEFISAVSGWDFTIEEGLKAGQRIQTLRQAFIIRGGISPNNFRLPERMSKILPESLLTRKAHDFDALKSSFYESMGWVKQGGKAGEPLERTLKELGLDGLVAEYGSVPLVR